MAKKNKNYCAQKAAVLGLAVMMSAVPVGPAFIPAYAAEVTAEETTEETAAETTDEVKSGNGMKESSAPVSIADVINEEKNAVSDAAVYQVRIGYEFDDGSFDEWARGTGWLVSEKYILTSQTLTDTTTKSALFAKVQESRTDMYGKVGITLSNQETTEAHLKVYVTDNKGNKVGTGAAIYKNGMAILPLNGVSGTSSCIFASDSKVSMQDGQEVGIKFAGTKNDLCEVQVTKGKVYTPAEEQGTATSAFYLTADTTKGNPLGAPVYDANGNIIGMITSVGTDDSLTAMSADALETFLTSNGVEYKTLAQVQAEQAAAEKAQAEKNLQDAEAAIVNTESLEEAIKKAESVDRASFTEDSVAYLDETVKAGNRILEDPGKTQTQVDTAAGNINIAMEELKEAGPLNKILSLITNNKKLVTYVGGGFVIVIVVGLYLKSSLKKIKKKKELEASTPMIDNDESDTLRRMEEEDMKAYENVNGPEETEADEEVEEVEEIEEIKTAGEPLVLDDEKNTVIPAKKDRFDDMPGVTSAKQSRPFSAPVSVFGDGFDDDEEFEEDDDIDITNRVRSKDEAIHAGEKVPGLAYADDGEEETGILDADGSEDTTVLSRHSAYLIRLETGRKIPITKDNFLVGKERRKVDYCVAGNGSVSRVHARISRSKDGYYIEDLKSTNFTFVNNQQIPEYRPILIKDGTLIRISDVEFEFHED